MKFTENLAQNKKVILEKWFDLIIDSYPSDSSNFLRNETNRFQNPVGYTISSDLERLFEAIVGKSDYDRLSECFENIVKIRTVQDFTPSQAVAFVLQLKNVVREVSGESFRERDALDEMLAFEAKVDWACLVCFDTYMKCKEKIFQLQADEAKLRVYKLLERTNLIDRKAEHGE
ncbi:MAG: RsbRD N-terminal domain-containing protein [Candidatus Zixiibacteriota bacterium]